MVNLSPIVERRILKAKRLLGSGFKWRDALLKFFDARGRKLPEIIVEQVKVRAKGHMFLISARRSCGDSFTYYVRFIIVENFNLFLSYLSSLLICDHCFSSNKIV